MIAENGQSGRTQIAYKTQRFQRARAAIDEISRKPEPVTRRIESDALQQTAQRPKTALNVTDCVGSHLYD